MIVCFGSLNRDLAVRVGRLPGPDETVLATGDAFVAGLAVALHKGADIVEAARFGAAAGACAVEVAGAEPSLPTRAAVQARLA